MASTSVTALVTSQMSQDGSGTVGFDPWAFLVAAGTAEADTNTDGLSGQTNLLTVKNSGFALPSGIVINGIVITIDVYAPSNSTYSINLNGAIAKTGTMTSSGGYSTRTFGSSSDLWGRAWAYTDINAATFATTYRATAVSTQAKVYARAWTATVYYTPTPTISHTLDVVLKKQYSPTHTLDTMLLARRSLTHTLDASLSTRSETSHTIDTVLDYRYPSPGPDEGEYEEHTDEGGAIIPVAPSDAGDYMPGAIEGGVFDPAVIDDTGEYGVNS